MVLNLHCHLILPRVASLRFTDENDAITVCVADANMGRFYRLAFFDPCNLWPWFALCTCIETLVKYTTQRCAALKEFGGLPEKAPQD